jgi:hypothetical protein
MQGTDTERLLGVHAYKTCGVDRSIDPMSTYLSVRDVISYLKLL